MPLFSHLQKAGSTGKAAYSRCTTATFNMFSAMVIPLLSILYFLAP